MIYSNRVKTHKPCGLCCTEFTNIEVKRGKTEILKDVTFKVNCGELTAIIGPNGAGKSTLLKAILGEIPHSGELRFLDPRGERFGAPLIGYVPQHIDFDKDSPISVLDFFSSSKTNIPVWLYHPKRIRMQVSESLSKVQAEKLIERRLGDLSGGELQRVLLALAIDPVPDLLLLDEPVSGIDQKGLEMFYNTVSQLRKEYDLSIILVSHDLPLVLKYADRVVLLNREVETFGTPHKVFKSKEFEDIFGSLLIRTWDDTYSEVRKGSEGL